MERTVLLLRINPNKDTPRNKTYGTKDTIHLKSLGGRKFIFIHNIIKTKRNVFFSVSSHITAAWLAQSGEHRSAEREVVGSNPGRANDQV